MLEPFMQKLAQQRIVLASGSPRRKLILQNIGLKFEVVPSTFEENLKKDDFKFPYEYAKETAQMKTLEVARRLSNDERLPDLIVGADTVVSLDNVIYEKPRDKDHALEILSKLSGRTHTVNTGVVFVWPKPGVRNADSSDADRFNLHSFHTQTDVEFAEVPTETLRAYIETGEPMDKAGGYGIQAAGGTLVKAIHGDYYNVMGFPLHMFSVHLVDFLKQQA